MDDSEAMLDVARGRLNRFDNVELHRATLESLPLDDASLDAATLILVLHHLPDPDKAVREVARVLRPGGRLLVVDMLPHDRQEYRQQMGHVWMGFTPERIGQTLEDAGFIRQRFMDLPADPAAKGPTLFAATGDCGAGVDGFHAQQVDKGVQHVDRSSGTTRSTRPGPPGASRTRSRIFRSHEFGRKEIRLAEQEMPGLMAIREKHRPTSPSPAPR